MWVTVSYVTITLGGLSLVTTIVLSVKWDVINMISVVSGGKSKRILLKYKKDYAMGAQVVEDDENKTNHITTEALLAASIKGTKDLAENRGLTNSRFMKPFNLKMNMPKGLKTSSFKDTNSDFFGTESSVANQEVGVTGQSELGGWDIDFTEEPSKNLSNNPDTFTSTGLSVNLSENAKIDKLEKSIRSKTGVLTIEDDIEEETTLLEDSIDFSFDTSDNKTSILIEETTILGEDTYDKTTVLDSQPTGKTGVLGDVEEVVTTSEDVELETTTIINEQPSVTGVLEIEEPETELTETVEGEYSTEDENNSSKTGVLGEVEDAEGTKTGILGEIEEEQPSVTGVLENNTKTGVLGEVEETEESTEDGKTSVLGETEEVEETEDGKTSILVDVDEEEVSTEDDGKTSILGEQEEDSLNSWTSTLDGKPTVRDVNKISITSQPEKVKIEITGEGEDDDEEEVEQEFEGSAKTQIITEDDLPKEYRRMLHEEIDSLEFHQFRVVEVVTSYDSASSINN